MNKLKKAYENEANAIYFCNAFTQKIVKTYSDRNNFYIEDGQKYVYCEKEYITMPYGYIGYYKCESELFINYDDAVTHLPLAIQSYEEQCKQRLIER